MIIILGTLSVPGLPSYFTAEGLNPNPVFRVMLIMEHIHDEKLKEQPLNGSIPIFLKLLLKDHENPLHYEIQKIFLSSLYLIILLHLTLDTMFPLEVCPLHSF